MSFYRDPKTTDDKGPTVTQPNGLQDAEQTLRGKTVLLTGHTGFTGSWATLWLSGIGAKVVGFSLAPATTPNLYSAMAFDDEVVSVEGDIRDYGQVLAAVEKTQPEIIIHLAAQALVRKSYRDPLETFQVNAIGTANVLEAARLTESVKAVICITTDKVYQNNEWSWPYRENDPLGGHDPYSTSKAAAEMIIQGYAKSFAGPGGRFAVAVARGGNIIGGGDWAEDRLIPDFVRAAVGDGKMTIRFPAAIRPWQHVLALVHGYILLASAVVSDPTKFGRAWNFGPPVEESYDVQTVLELLSATWKRPDLEFMKQPLAEAQTLLLDSGLSRRILGWCPPWDTRTAIERTAEWYQAYYKNPDSARALCESQLAEWRSLLGAGIATR